MRNLSNRYLVNGDSLGAQGRLYGVAKAPMAVVIFHGNDLVSSGSSRSDQRFTIDRLNAEQIDHANLNAARLQFIESFQSFEERDSRGNHQHAILLTLTDDLRFPDLELLLRSVDNGIIRPSQTKVGRAHKFRR